MSIKTLCKLELAVQTPADAALDWYTTTVNRP